MLTAAARFAALHGATGAQRVEHSGPRGGAIPIETSAAPVIFIPPESED
jgi:hypothetical protein